MLLFKLSARLTARLKVAGCQGVSRGLRRLLHAALKADQALKMNNQQEVGGTRQAAASLQPVAVNDKDGQRAESDSEQTLLYLPAAANWDAAFGWAGGPGQGLQCGPGMSAALPTPPPPIHRKTPEPTPPPTTTVCSVSKSPALTQVM